MILTKKVILGLAIAMSCFGTSYGQISNGGLPLSLQIQSTNQKVPIHTFDLPDWKADMEKMEKGLDPGAPRPYLAGKFVPTDLNFPNSGTFSQENGVVIWRTQVYIEDAPAIGFYFDKFHLPKDVQFFLTNSNLQQILGAYTAQNNSDDGYFATEPVEGGLINLELNISPDADLAQLQLHINRVAVYFRSISYLAKYTIQGNTPATPTDGSPDQFNFEGNSSTCGINAICPDGANYPKQRKATVQTITPLGNNYVGLCSATLVNNTGNTPTNCKQYLLTATHCEGSNSTTDLPYSQILVRFNFEKPQCQGGPLATVSTMTGVTFRARANYIETTSPQINGDFLLVELKQNIPTSWDAYLAGWNRATNIPTTETLPKKFIGFHHPSGDVKKLSTAQTININGDAGGSAGPGTHYEVDPQTGGIEQGSSGSGLFDGNGRLIGIASVAGAPDPSCNVNGKGGAASFLKFVDYSKFNYDWDYSLDGNSNFRKLKPWLDPANTGATTMNAVKSNCSDITPNGVTITENNFDQSISIYPNPTTNGLVNAKINLENTSDLNVTVYDITGRTQTSFQLKKVKDGTFSFDLSTLSNGVYLLKFDNGTTKTIKKIMLAK